MYKGFAAEKRGRAAYVTEETPRCPTPNAHYQRLTKAEYVNDFHEINVKI